MLLAILPASAGAVTFGADLSRPANYKGDCTVRPIFPFPPGAATCTVTNSGALFNPAETFAVPDTGTLTAVRVKVGSITGPMRVEILRAYRAPGSVAEIACCFGFGESQVFIPAANAITTVPVNLPVRADHVPDSASGVFNFDTMALSVLQPGVPIPMHDTGDYSGNGPTGGAYFPAFEDGQERVDMAGFSGYQVLMQGELTPSGQTSGEPPGANPAPPKSVVPASPVDLGARVARVRNGRVAIPLVCRLTTLCDGRLQLLGRAPGAAAAAAKRKKKTSVYGRSRFRIPAGKTRKVKVKLNGAGKRALKRRKRLKVIVRMTVGHGSSKKTTRGRLTLKLKRSKSRGR